MVSPLDSKAQETTPKNPKASKSQDEPLVKVDDEAVRTAIKVLFEEILFAMFMNHPKKGQGNKQSVYPETSYNNSVFTYCRYMINLVKV